MWRDNNNNNNDIIVRSTRGLGDSASVEIRIWKWNQDTETLVPLRGDNDNNRLEIMRLKANLGGLRRMGALFSYRTRNSGGTHQDSHEDGEEESPGSIVYDDWTKLTNRLTPQILSRILGSPFMNDDGRPSWSINSASSAARDADNIPGISTETVLEVTKNFGNGNDVGEKEKDLQFLPVDLKWTWRKGAIGRERTEAAQDRSWALGNLIEKYNNSNNDNENRQASDEQREGEGQILGELQFCFLMILTLMNYSCLEQWKRLLTLILTCRTAIRERESFFKDVLQLLRLQLQHCEDVVGGLFDMDGDYDGNFLRKLLTGFRQSVYQLEDFRGTLVRSEIDALEQWVRAEYGWELRKDMIMRRGMLQLEDGEQIEMEMTGVDEDDETGEYAPVVVNMGENGEIPFEEVEDNLTDVDTPMT